MEALSHVSGRRTKEQQCWLGSVKTNIGHLEAAPGQDSSRRCSHSVTEIPNLHFQKINRTFDWSRRRSPFRPRGGVAGGRMVAGVSSFGFGGANAHAVRRKHRLRASTGGDRTASAFTDPFRRVSKLE